MRERVADSMGHRQSDLFAQDDAERNKLSELDRSKIRARLEHRLARLEAAAAFPWNDPLDAVHEESRFQRDADMLGEEGAVLWAPFDREMDRLYSMLSTLGYSCRWSDVRNLSRNGS